MTFKTELAEIEKEIDEDEKENCGWLVPRLKARKTQLLKDQEIHEKIMKEFVEKLKEAIYNLREFFESDMWYACHSEWKTEKDMLRYLDSHFRVLEKELVLDEIDKLYEEMEK